MKKKQRSWRRTLDKEERELISDLDRKIRALKDLNIKTDEQQDRLDLLRLQRHRIQMRASTRARRSDFVREV